MAHDIPNGLMKNDMIFNSCAPKSLHHLIIRAKGRSIMWCGTPGSIALDHSNFAASQNQIGKKKF